jgi:hypothetical protein
MIDYLPSVYIHSFSAIMSECRHSADQIKDLPKSYVAYDDVEIGSGNKIPLWLFGFLY